MGLAILQAQDRPQPGETILTIASIARLWHRTACLAALLSIAVMVAPAGAYDVKVEKISQGFRPLWALTFGPDNLLYSTMRNGNIIRLTPQPGPTAAPVTGIFGVPRPRLQDGAGLMGIAVDPEFSDNGFLYICYSLRNADGTPGNRISRLHVDGHNFDEETVLLDHLPGDDIHNGCPLVISPDGDYLFVGTGDGGHAGKAQDPSYPGGKILRIELDGSVPWWNPFFGSPVWSVGFRNPRGLRFRPDSDELWVTDQGYDTQDEIDLVEKRGNYGWPNCRGTAICGDIPNYHAAIAEFDHDSNIEISDLTFYKGDAFPQWNGSLLFASLKAGRLYRAEMDGDKIVRTDIVIDGEYGRLSGIAEGPDGMLYIATDNDDDAVLRVSPN